LCAKASVCLYRLALSRLVGSGKKVLTSSAKVWYGEYRLPFSRCSSFGKKCIKHRCANIVKKKKPRELFQETHGVILLMKVNES